MLFRVVLVCLITINLSYAQKCDRIRTSYFNDKYSMVCSNITDKFPNSTNTVDSVSCVNCNLPVLHEDIIDFRGSVLNLTFSHVKNITAGAFKNFDNNINRVLLSNNEIEYIELGTFKNIKLLDELNLQWNKLNTLPPKLFENMTIMTMDISNNYFMSIDAIFDNSTIRKLNASFNAIEIISPDTFKNVTFRPGISWKHISVELYLNNNQIKKLPPTSFANGRELRYLFLQSNQLETIENDTFVELELLRFLNLDDNLIATLNTYSFRGLQNLLTFTLNKNRISSLPFGLFANLKRLELLSLASNELTTLDLHTFSGLGLLLKLNISNNHLRRLDEAYIFPLGKLYSLDLSNNGLNDLNLDEILKHHTRLRELSINDNFWTCKHLVEMYRLINQKTGGFNYPSNHYEVPNLHGIACSRISLPTKDDMTFDDFLKEISQDLVIEDLYDVQLQNKGIDELNILKLIDQITGIYWMLLIIVVILLIVFVKYSLQCVCVFLQRNAIISNKYNLFYERRDDSVSII